MTRLDSASANAADVIAEEGLIGDPVPLWKQTWQRLLRKRSGQVGLIIIGALLLIAYTILAMVR